jgi:hypothetical protein
MPRFVGSRLTAVVLLAVAGCHFRAGLGPAPEPPPSQNHSTLRDRSVSPDGTITVDETVTDTTSFADGRSRMVQTATATTTHPDGTTASRKTVTTTDQDRNGGTTSSTTSSSGN